MKLIPNKTHFNNLLTNSGHKVKPFSAHFGRFQTVSHLLHLFSSVLWRYWLSDRTVSSRINLRQKCQQLACWD